MKPLVIIPILDRLDMTRALVEELARQGEADQILILDNGSEEEATLDWLKEQKLATVENTKGMNIHQQWNFGLDQANSRHVAILNNDISIGEHFLSSLAHPMIYSDRLVATCPNYDGRPGYIQLTRDICANRYDGTGGFAGFAFMLQADFAALYRFPEELNWWFGDNHLIETINMSGLFACIVCTSTVEHLDRSAVSNPKVQQWADQDVQTWKARGTTLDTIIKLDAVPMAQ